MRCFMLLHACTIIQSVMNGVRQHALGSPREEATKKVVCFVTQEILKKQRLDALRVQVQE